MALPDCIESLQHTKRQYFQIVRQPYAKLTAEVNRVNLLNNIPESNQKSNAYPFSNSLVKYRFPP